MAEGIVPENRQLWLPARPTQSDRQNYVYGKSYDWTSYGEFGCIRVFDMDVIYVVGIALCCN